MTFKPFLLLLLVSVLTVCLGFGQACAQQPRPTRQPPATREYELKAVWLYQFGNKLVEWNDESDSPFVIGVFGNLREDFQFHLGRVERLRIRNRPVRIEHYRSLDDLTQQKKPDILFISKDGPANESAADRVRKAQRVQGGRKVLIVGDTDENMNQIALSFHVDQSTRRILIRRNEDALPEGVEWIPDSWDQISNFSDVRTQPTSTDTRTSR